MWCCETVRSEATLTRTSTNFTCACETTVSRARTESSAWRCFRCATWLSGPAVRCGVRWLAVSTSTRLAGPCWGSCLSEAVTTWRASSSSSSPSADLSTSRLRRRPNTGETGPDRVANRCSEIDASPPPPPPLALFSTRKRAAGFSTAIRNVWWQMPRLCWRVLTSESQRGWKTTWNKMDCSSDDQACAETGLNVILSCRCSKTFRRDGWERFSKSCLPGCRTVKCWLQWETTRLKYRLHSAGFDTTSMLGSSRKKVINLREIWCNFNTFKCWLQHIPPLSRVCLICLSIGATVVGDNSTDSTYDLRLLHDESDRSSLRQVRFSESFTRVCPPSRHLLRSHCRTVAEISAPHITTIQGRF